MKNIRLLFLLVFSTWLLACQPEKTIIVEQREGNTGTGSHNNGGTDSGGGNGLGGRNIEDYAVNIQEDPSFRQFVEPLILKVAETHPRFASDMIHITVERTWYKVPASLKALKAAQIGVSFGDEEIQQFALQNLKSIWLDSRHYNKPETTEDSRARLLLHEILMGVRLMKMKNSLDNCYSEVAILNTKPETRANYKKGREYCAQKYMLDATDPIIIPGRNTDLELTGDDYDNIRGLGVILWNAKGEISKVELDAWLKANKFRNY